MAHIREEKALVLACGLRGLLGLFKRFRLLSLGDINCNAQHAQWRAALIGKQHALGIVPLDLPVRPEHSELHFVVLPISYRPKNRFLNIPPVFRMDVLDKALKGLAQLRYG